MQISETLKTSNPITPTEDRVSGVTYIVPGTGEMFVLSFPKKLPNGSIRWTCNFEHQKTQTRAETTNKNRPEAC